MKFVYVFLVGGLLCAIAQILIDKTKLSPARIMVGYVVVGVLLTAVGLYEPLVKFAHAGATVPIMGFGYTLAKGAAKAVGEKGWLGVLGGGVSGAGTGIAAAVVFGFLCAVFSKPKAK
ncbi:MAG: stage V sporulation protein AE [Clostridia bacterium]|nr:stage V sporulation protein AE [Clostridia bacterium]